MTAMPSNHSKLEFTMKENFLVGLSKQFAVDIVNLCTDIKITEEEYKDMFAKCSKIRKLLIASITTAKENV